MLDRTGKVRLIKYNVSTDEKTGKRAKNKTELTVQTDDVTNTKGIKKLFETEMGCKYDRTCDYKADLKGEPFSKRFQLFFLFSGRVIHIVFFFVLVVLILNLFFIANCVVPSESMEDTLQVGDFIFVNRLAYKGDSSPKRNDIVVFQYPDDENVTYVKRCIGLPGEVVTIKDGTTTIDGKKVQEPFVTKPYTGDYGSFYVPKVGDRVEYDSASKTAWCNGYAVGDKNFINKYCTKRENEYTVKADCYFMLGDNRDESMDSRFWTNRYVVKDKITGPIF